MIIYPAIDLKDGKCVRLRQGKFDDVTVYSENPHEIAQYYAKCGAKNIHVVDLDGALNGVRKNGEAIARITRHAPDACVQLGGGIRDLESIEKALKLGVKRVIIGTAAVSDPDFVKKAVALYGDAVIVGIDAKDNKVATHGWESVSSVLATEMAKQMQALGVQTIIYTDIATDGMLQGPNFAATTEMCCAVDIDIIASGGISSAQDVYDLEGTGASGVIIGKAIYEKRLDIAKVIKKVMG